MKINRSFLILFLGIFLLFVVSGCSDSEECEACKENYIAGCNINQQENPGEECSGLADQHCSETCEESDSFLGIF